MPFVVKSRSLIVICYDNKDGPVSVQIHPHITVSFDCIYAWVMIAMCLSWSILEQSPIINETGFPRLVHCWSD